MKVRDSGMPEESMWSTFFEPESILRQMGLTADMKLAVDLGSGFGTFSIPASQIINGEVHAFDIEDSMLQVLQEKSEQLEIGNIVPHLKDFIAEGTGLPDDSADYVMLFNILHHDNPLHVLREVYRVLKPGGKAGIIHWRSDIVTPRGPSLDIRPTPVQCHKWAAATGFTVSKELILNPYHFGLIIVKP
jgi:Methylase involved in ubiquinone/menaquinone biosynthesis